MSRTRSYNQEAESVLTIYSALYEIYFELNCIIDCYALTLVLSSDHNRTLTQIMFQRSTSSSLSSPPDQPYIEWIPTVMSTQYQLTDQLIQWLLTLINISFDYTSTGVILTFTYAIMFFTEITCNSIQKILCFRLLTTLWLVCGEKKRFLKTISNTLTEKNTFNNMLLILFETHDV